MVKSLLISHIQGESKLVKTPLMDPTQFKYGLVEPVGCKYGLIELLGSGYQTVN